MKVRILLVLILPVERCMSYSYMVNCGTPMSSAGHNSYTASGSGSPVLQRSGSSLACGSTLNPGEQLGLTSSGTNGMSNNLFLRAFCFG